MKPNKQRKKQPGIFIFIICILFFGITSIAHGREIIDYLSNLPFEMPVLEAPQFPNHAVNIRDFGAVGDGHTLNTQAIQQAIDACAADSGGKVSIPPGIWFTGPLQLRSNINLHLQQGALLLFDGFNENYPLVEVVWDGVGRFRCQAPIFAYRLENIAITGEGVIDGSGDLWRPVKKFKMTDWQWRALLESGGAVNSSGTIWWPSEEALHGAKYIRKLENSGREITAEDYRKAGEYLRPVLINLVECKNILLDGPTFQNSPGWNIHPLLCENLIIRNITVRNPWYSQNGDGLDLESCRNVLLYNSRFDVGDDAMCIKSGRDEAGRRRGKPTENVIIENCVVYHGHGGFVVGSEMSGGVRNISVKNCTFIGTDTGLRFKSTRGRGGVVENIYIGNILMTDIPNEAIRFNMYYQGKAPTPENEDDPDAVEIPVPPVTEETPRFQKIYIHNLICKGAARAVLLQGLPEMPIREIELTDIQISADAGLMCIDADQIQMKHVQILPKRSPVFFFYNSQNVTLQKPSFTDDADVVFQLAGKQTQNIYLKEIELKSIKDKIQLGKGVRTDAVIQK
jgi:polygalacturonase